MYNNLLSTKFIFGIILVVMGFVFAILKMCPVEQFFTFAEVVGSVYVIGNVSASIVEKVGGTTVAPNSVTTQTTSNTTTGGTA